MANDVTTAQDIAPIAQGQKDVEQARDLSLQARATGPGAWGSSGLLFYLAQAGALIAPWWSRQRDLDLGRFWQNSDHLSGALGTLISKVVSVPPHVEPRDTALKSHMRQADELNRVLVEESEFGGGWIDCASKGLQDYWCLAGHTRVHLGGERRGQTKTIVKIVKDKDQGPVLSLSKEGRLVERKVTNWYRSPLGDRRWWWLSLAKASWHSRNQKGGIFTTEDHPILTKSGWLPAREVEPGMLVATGDPVPNSLQSQLLTGALLGDAGMSFVRKRAALRFAHGIRQEKWLDLKLSALKGFHWAGRHHRFSEGLPRSGKNGNKHEGIALNSRASLGLNNWHEAFYPNGKKVVPRELVKKNFSPLMLAAWFLDDGSLHEVKTTIGNLVPQVTFYTNSFTESDVQWLAELLTSHGIPSKMRVNSRPRDEGKTYPVIAVGVKGSRRLMELIGSYIPPCMRHKATGDAPPFDPEAWNLGTAKAYWDRVVVSKQRDYRSGKGTVRTTYNLSVDETETFIAAQTVVHNCSDNGIFQEIIGGGKKDGPIKGMSQGLAHLDSHRCTRTGNPDYPVVYRDTDGTPVKYHWTRVAFASDMPSGRASMLGVGHCALGRCINVGQNLVDIGIYKQEKLGSRPFRGILLGRGVKTDVIVSSLEVSQEIMDNQSLQRHAKLPVIGDLSPEATIEILNLASLPDGFDEETSTKLGMFTIALAFGVPVRWIWPASSAGATKADAMYQHIAGLGGGIGKVLRVLTLMLSGDPRASHSERGKFLPPHLKLVFDFQDDEQDRMRVDIAEKRAKTRKENVEAQVFSIRVAREQALSDGDISQAQFAELELEDGRLPGGSDVLALFSSVDDTLLRLLDLGVMEPLAVHVNDPFRMLDEIDLAALLAQEALVNAGSRGEREKAAQALAALGKLKTIYAPEAQRIVEEETALEMQVAAAQEAETETEGEEPEVAEGEKGFDFGVSVGEVISGQLARGAGGKFVNVEQLKAQLRAGILARRQQAGEAAESKPSKAAVKKAENRAATEKALGLPGGMMDMLLAMRSGSGELDPHLLGDAFNSGFVKRGPDGKPYMTTLGRTVLGAGNAGNVDRARGAIAKKAETISNQEKREQAREAKAAEREAKRQQREREREAKRQQREAERERKAEDRERERQEEAAAREQEKQETLQSNRSGTAQALSGRGVRELDFSALGAFRNGGGLDAETAKRLAASGLVEIGPDGEARLTADGRAVATAADAGDTRRAMDELSEGREKVAKTLEKAEGKIERASDAREKADEYWADADGYDSQADEFWADADKWEDAAALFADSGDAVEAAKAIEKAGKARDRAERKQEQAEAKRKRAADKLESAEEYDEEARRLHDSVGGDAASAREREPEAPVDTVTESEEEVEEVAGPGRLEVEGGPGVAGEQEQVEVELETSGEGESGGLEVEGGPGVGGESESVEVELEAGSEGTEVEKEKGLRGLISRFKERELVKPRGKPLAPVEEDEVKITDEEVDAAIAEWNESMPVEARGILDAKEATPEEAARYAEELEEKEPG